MIIAAIGTNYKIYNMKFTKLFLALSMCLIIFGVTAQEPSVPLEQPEVEARFDGGVEAMKTYIINNIEYPAVARKNGDQGKVFIRFVVNTDGSIANVEVLKGVSEAIDAEAMRLINEMPNWIPAETGGEKVKSSVVLPINFALD